MLVNRRVQAKAPIDSELRTTVVIFPEIRRCRQEEFPVDDNRRRGTR